MPNRWQVCCIISRWPILGADFDKVPSSVFPMIRFHRLVGLGASYDQWEQNGRRRARMKMGCGPVIWRAAENSLQHFQLVEEQVLHRHVGNPLVIQGRNRLSD